MLLQLLILVLPVLVNVAFVTLLERKILGFSQLRLGPNKVSFSGLLQPFRDAIKLFTKQAESNYNVNWKLFFFRPVIILATGLILWRVAPLNRLSFKWPVMIIRLLVILRLGVYPLLIRGWASNSKYAALGALRGVAQTISYEISLALIIIQLILVFMSYCAKDQLSLQFRVIYFRPILLIIWLVILLAETNRTPFDFSEGESELVSGFNIEYGATGFILIFLREYAIILLFSALTTTIFFSLNLFRLLGAMFTTMMARLWIILRATLPRYRYDLLIRTAWKTYLPGALGVISLLRLILIF